MADKEELFDIVDEDDRVIGQAPRSKAHAEGLLHRAVYVWVLDDAGNVLVQRRSAEKKIGPNQWDLSVAEHLQPGETFEQGALRGLREELGLRCELDDLFGPLAATHRRDLRVGPFHDAELVRSYVLRVREHTLTKIDPEEVAEVAWLSVADLVETVARKPREHTAWLRAEGAFLGWFGARGARATWPWTRWRDGHSGYDHLVVASS